MVGLAKRIPLWQRLNKKIYHIWRCEV
ncbi:Protein of unknown function [Thermobacillus xylanilyticus]|uniref:Uncharacterized protein n=1 Tax=Thermobacillus xylanilyticus TaxID=76633 RepID=A0ABM8V316_THEXY|nr:Protein of unknown function [Thermobacillus xylanilyticus]